MRKFDFFKRMMKVSLIGAGVIVLSSCEKDCMNVKGANPAISGSAIHGASSVVYSYALGDEWTSPMAVASNGETVTMEGTGTLTVKGKVATGGGNYYSSDPAVGSGTWAANQLSSFESYGSSGTSEVGGKAVIKVTLYNSAGSVRQAVLQITNCEGDEPSSCADGIRLDVKGGLNFNTEVRGPISFE